MKTIETRVLRPLLTAMDRYRYTWAIIGIGTLMVAWVVFTAWAGSFTGGPVTGW